ncbi:hypothetical protein [Labilibacter marinus]|uniref:hypothetical protein n=1 Tax=Labilibacter marinus TaxID=1477105 RepID=UPI001179B1C2|nr:hypothetical protein [Labilibacter marinus]
MFRNLDKTLIVCIILLISCSVSGQYRKKRNKFLEGLKIQPKAGVNMFYGDLVSQGRTNYTFGVAGEKELLPYLNARIDLNYGSMKGQQINPGVTEPYAYFKNSYIDASIGASFRPLDLFYGLFKQRLFNPYVIGQFGIVSYNADEWYGPEGLYGREGDGQFWRNKTGISPNISLGGGLNYYINSHYSLTAEFIANKPFTDLLDAHEEWNDADGNIYPTDAGDFFYTATIGITYLFDDSQWKNSPKYNRKAYLRTRSLYKSNVKKYKRPSKRKSKRYKR